jgi:peptidoglycan/LPS O-acetylase OafA/YrhL
MARTVERWAFLDALRALAAFGVIATHCGLFDGGARGVQLFFVISGFTLMHSWHERQGTADEFFIRRFFRIAPMYYLGIVGTLCVQGLGPRYWAPSGISGWDILANMLFVHSFVPNAANSVVSGGWSIGDEMTFYLLVPLIVTVVRGITSALVLFAASCAVALLLAPYTLGIFAPADYVNWSMFFLWPPAQLPVFCAGIAAYFIFRALPCDGRWRFPTGLLLLAAAAGGTAWTMAKGYGVGYEIRFAIWFALLLLGLSLAPLRVLVNPVTGFLGRISYSVYLLHWFVLALGGLGAYVIWVPQALQSTAVTVLVFAATAALSTATYHAVEKPFIQLGSYIIRRRRLRAAGDRQVVVTAGAAA